MEEGWGGEHVRALIEKVKNPRESSVVLHAERQARSLTDALDFYAMLLAADARLGEAERECWSRADARYTSVLPVISSLRGHNHRRRVESFVRIHMLSQDVQAIAGELRQFAEINKCFSHQMRDRFGVGAGAATTTFDESSEVVKMIQEYTRIAEMEEDLARELEEYGQPAVGDGGSQQQPRPGPHGRGTCDGAAAKGGDEMHRGASGGHECDVSAEKTKERDNHGKATHDAQPDCTEGREAEPAEDIDRVPETFDPADEPTNSEDGLQSEGGRNAHAKENDTSNINSQREKLSESLGTPDSHVNPTPPSKKQRKHCVDPDGERGRSSQEQRTS